MNQVGAGMNFADLARVTGVIQQDPQLLQQLQQAQVNWLRDNLNNDAQQWKQTGDPTTFLTDARAGTATQSFFAKSAAVIGQDNANLAAQHLLNQVAEARIPFQIIGSLPLGPEVSIPASLANSALADAGGLITPSQGPTQGGDAQQLAIPSVVERIAGDAILTHSLNSPTYLRAQAGPNEPFVSGYQPPVGLPAPDYASSLSNWLGQPLPTNNVAVSVGSTIADGSDSGYLKGLIGANAAGG